MRGDDVLESEDVAHDGLEAIEACAPGIRFIPSHHGRPLLRTHGCRAAVRQQVYDDVLRLDQKEVVAGLAQVPLTLLARRHADGLDDFDPKRLDDGLHRRPSDVACVESKRMARYSSDPMRLFNSSVASARGIFTLAMMRRPSCVMLSRERIAAA